MSMPGLGVQRPTYILYYFANPNYFFPSGILTLSFWSSHSDKKEASFCPFPN